MKDKFEIFIRESVLNNSESLTNRGGNWNAAKKRLRMRKKKRRITYLSIAASFLILLSFGLTIFLSENKSSNEYYSEELLDIKEASCYYSSQIELKYQQVSEFKNFNNDYFEVFYTKLSILNKEYESYMDDANTYGFQEDIIRALINNQQSKLFILNRLLDEIKKVKDYENRKVIL